MSNFLTALTALAWVLAGMCAIALAALTVSQLAVLTLQWREARDTRHDLEDRAVFGPREKWGAAADITWRQHQADEAVADLCGWTESFQTRRDRVHALIAANEARRVDDEWRAFNERNAS
jgi:hypothetical protein